MEAILRREIIIDKTMCRVIGVTVFVILTALGAFVRIPLPFSPVPITLQTFFVLLSGAFLSSRLGTLSQFSYIILGVAGLPCFAGAGSGIFYILGPTGGYLIGFILASFLLGNFIKLSKNNATSVFLSFCMADFVLLISGVLWLKVIFGYNFGRLMFIGFFPFVIGDLIKIAAATAIYLKLQSRIKEIF